MCKDLRSVQMIGQLCSTCRDMHGCQADNSHAYRSQLNTVFQQTLLAGSEALQQQTQQQYCALIAVMT